MMNYNSIWLSENSNAYEFSADAVFSSYHRNGEKMEFPQFMVIVKGNGKNILVDTGIDPSDPEIAAYCAMYGFQNAHSPAYVLDRIGLKPEDIDAVILTHVHWDHMGALGCYPNAQIYVQKREVQKWIEILALPERYSHIWGAASATLMSKLIALMAEHRVTLLDGDVDNLFPGIHIRSAFDSHTPGSQFVVIENGTDTFVSTGDVSYVMENLFGVDEKGKFIPNGFASGDVLSIMKTMDRILACAGHDPNKIIAIHDSGLWSKYKGVVDADGLHLLEVCLAPDETSKL
jgi:Zn-dependent hydrolases, including glyoxylases